MVDFKDAEHVSLEDLRKRIEETDLVPSRAPLLDEIETKMNILKQQGITTLAGLRKTLKNSRQMEDLSQKTGIDPQYLTLLRREIESYIPKPLALKDFDWIAKAELDKLEKIGIHDSAALYLAANNAQNKMNLAQSSGIDLAVLEELLHLADLTRVQWVSPLFARMLTAASYDSASHLAEADANVLHAAILRVNEGHQYFKGTLGLRDIKRLIQAARYV